MTIIQHPKVYEFIQNIVGAHEIRNRLRQRIAFVKKGENILDVGAGTGLYRPVFQEGRYIALEMDAKRAYFLRDQKSPDAVVVGNAASLCFKDQSVDYVFCSFLAHHLSEAEFSNLLRETSRVIRRKLIFIDPLADSKSWLRKGLWALDQGKYPRTSEQLSVHIQSAFDIEHQEQFQILHRYFLCIAKSKAALP